MTQFFADASKVNTEEHRIIIDGDDYNHIKNVLRMKQGEEFSVRVQGEPREYRCSVSEYTESEVICEIRFIKERNKRVPETEQETSQIVFNRHVIPNQQ